MQKTDESTGEDQLSPDTPGDEELLQVSCTPESVLCVRFVFRQYRRDAADFSKDEEEIDTEQGLAATTSDADASQTDAATAAADNDRGFSTPGQVDWIVVTSHADNTVRFRNPKASY